MGPQAPEVGEPLGSNVEGGADLHFLKKSIQVKEVQKPWYYLLTRCCSLHSGPLAGGPRPPAPLPAQTEGSPGEPQLCVLGGQPGCGWQSPTLRVCEGITPCKRGQSSSSPGELSPPGCEIREALLLGESSPLRSLLGCVARTHRSSAFPHRGLSFSSQRKSSQRPAQNLRGQEHPPHVEKGLFRHQGQDRGFGERSSVGV